MCIVRIYMKSAKIIKIIEKDGWIQCYQKGRVTVPHPKKDLPIKTVASIFKQAGINKETIK